MNRMAFLHILGDGLAGLPAREIDDILADYAAYFDEAHASGRSEEDVANALGDPRRLARELRAESGLRRWENHRSLGNSATALLALGGLAAVDILFLLPLLFAVTLAMLIICLVIFVLGIIGFGLLLSLFKIAALCLDRRNRAARDRGHRTDRRQRRAAACCCCSRSNGAVKMLGNYARLHYRLLRPEQHSA